MTPSSFDRDLFCVTTVSDGSRIMKRSYQPPRVITQKVRFGVFGNYGTATDSGNDLYDSGRFAGS